jgi:hypothetical protein
VSLDPQSQVREQVQEKKRIKQEKKKIKVDEISHPRMNFDSKVPLKTMLCPSSNP